MFKTSEDSILTIIEATCPNLVFINIPEFVDYSNFNNFFKELGWSVVDLLLTTTKLDILSQNIKRNIELQCPTVVFGDIEDYDDLFTIFGDDWFAYIYIYPNNKKKYASLVKDNKTTLQLLDKYKKRLKNHSEIRPILVCLI